MVSYLMIKGRHFRLPPVQRTPAIMDSTSRVLPPGSVRVPVCLEAGVDLLLPA